jgi:preprotein translocase subunit SecD
VAKRPVRGTRGGSRGTRPAWIRLGVLGGVIVFLFASMFISGHTAPKLGLDLQGGTSVTLRPKLVDANGKALPNQKIPSGAINQAVDIIRQRVNGLGVSEAQVVKAGNNIEISVPGKGRNDVVDLVGQTAQLAFRIPYAEENAATAAAAPTPSASATPSAGASPSAAASPKASAKVTPSTAVTRPAAPRRGVEARYRRRLAQRPRLLPLSRRLHPRRPVPQPAPAFLPQP